MASNIIPPPTGEAPEPLTDPTFSTLSEGQIPKANANQKLVPSGVTVDSTTGKVTIPSAALITGELTVGGTIETNAGLTLGDNSTQFIAATKDGFGWHITGFKSGPKFNVLGQDLDMRSIFFRDDGLKAFMTGNQNIQAYEYDLAIPFDLESISFNPLFFIGLTPGTTYEGISFRNDHSANDGKSMFTVDQDNGNLQKYDLTTAWDIRTASLAATKGLLNGAIGTYRDLYFRQDGKAFYVVQRNTNLIEQYSLTTAWDISTLSFVNSFAVSGQTSSSQGVTFKPDGSIMYVSGDGDVFEYQLSTPWAIETTRFVESKDVKMETAVVGMDVKPDGTSLFVQSLNQGVLADLELGNKASVFNSTGPINADEELVTGTGVIFGDNSSQFRGATEDGNGWHIKSLSQIETPFDTTTEDGFMNGIYIRADGLKMYTSGNANNQIDEYDLATPWALEGAIHLQTLPVTTQTSDPNGVSFSEDGLTMFVVGGTPARVFQYALTTAWDISTATIQFTLDVSSQNTFMVGVYFKLDGKSMYMSGASREIYRYDLSVAWDVESAEFITSKDLSAELSSMRGISFKPDGYTLYLGTFNEDELNEYKLDTAWDITTVSLVDTLVIPDVDMHAVYFKADGTQIFIVSALDGFISNYGVGVDVKGLSVFNEIESTNKVLASGGVEHTNGSTSFYGSTPTPFLSIDSANLVDTFDTTVQDASLFSLFVRPDGLKAYTLGDEFKNIYEYDLATPWVLTGISFNQSISALVGGIITPRGLYFKPDGLALFLTDRAKLLVSMTLTTAWDISTATLQSILDLSFLTTTSTQGVFFKDTGESFYIAGGANGDIYRFDMSTNWDILTGKLTATNSSLALQKFQVSFNPTGDRMYVSSKENLVDEYLLTTPWDINSEILLNTLNTDVGTGILASCFSPDGSHLILADSLLMKLDAYDMGIKVPGKLSAQGIEVEFKNENNIQVIDQTSLGAVAGVVTVTGQVTYDFKVDITANIRFELAQDASVAFRGRNVFIYTGTGELFSMVSGAKASVVDFGEMVFVGAVPTATALAIAGGGDPSALPESILRMSVVNFIGFTNLGKIQDFGTISINELQLISWDNGLTLENNRSISMSNVNNSTALTAANTAFRITGNKTQFVTIGVSAFNTASAKPFFFIDPDILATASVVIERAVDQSENGTFFEPGAVGAITLFADAMVTSTGIDSVSDSSGTAQFNFTVGPTLFVNQKVTIVGFITNTDYNVVDGIITAVGAGTFEIAGIAFGTTEASGSFTSASVRVTSTAHGRSPGDTLLILDTFEYNCGSTIYNVTTNNFSINKPFSTGETSGTWDTGSLTEKDKRVQVDNSGEQADSRTIAFGEMNANTSVTTIAVANTYQAIDATTVNQNSATSRFTLIDAINGTWRYDGLNPISGIVTAILSAIKSGATANYRFSISIDGSVPVFASASYAPLEVKTTKVHAPFRSPISDFQPGQTFQMMVAGDGTSDNITITDISLDFI